MKLRVLACSLVSFLLSPPCLGNEDLTVYTYDAFTGSDSFGEYLEKSFLKKTGKKIKFVNFGTAGEALNQIILEGESSRADILLGLDEVLFNKGKSKGLFENWEPNLFSSLETFLVKPGETLFLPVDYGYLAFVYDKNRTQALEKPKLQNFYLQLKRKQKIVLQDPRTSSLGIEFLIWTKLASGNLFKTFWQSLEPSILTISPGWTGAYELFLRKRADFVLSYTTSTAYHRIREKKNNIVPLFFEGGHFRQVEGMVKLKKGGNKKLAIQFAQFVLGREAQEQLPFFQWMYPAKKNTNLVPEFKDIPVPQTLEVNWDEVNQSRDQWIQEWALTLATSSGKRK